ncbi:TIGR03086 family metal-binding protein [Allorhizocola rhizosphaerae]|uniref:TIGR03086 family metal-binding protein n=1 Tax=Allorhizocola rhizosphaerae TaxID=1872709 RepID=UPI001FE8C3FB|nr:TIGR03086 family metal-binding protein [Allorhizocola rhizosphaerae]
MFTVIGTALDALDRATTGAIDTGRLDDPTPCSAWTVAQVLFHAAGDQHAWASIVGSGSSPSYDPFNPPHRLDEGVAVTVAKAIEAATAAWAGVDPAAQSVRTPLPPVPTMAPELAAAACALDAAVHAWDVAVATGQPSPLTAALAEQLMPAARATAEPLRGFAYAAALPAQPDDDPAAALLRYLGRNPHWTP